MTPQRRSKSIDDYPSKFDWPGIKGLNLVFSSFMKALNCNFTMFFVKAYVCIIQILPYLPYFLKFRGFRGFRIFFFYYIILISKHIFPGSPELRQGWKNPVAESPFATKKYFWRPDHRPRWSIWRLTFRPRVQFGDPSFALCSMCEQTVL